MVSFVSNQGADSHSTGSGRPARRAARRSAHATGRIALFPRQDEWVSFKRGVRHSASAHKIRGLVLAAVEVLALTNPCLARPQ